MMDIETNGQPPKQERTRTRWTPELDKIFADIVVEQIQLGNRPNNVFDKKTWNQIREDFNRQANLSFNNNQLRKHLDVLRTRYHSLQPSADQSNNNQIIVAQDPCYIGFDLWEDIAGQPKVEPTKTKECPIYKQLCTIFADTAVDGKYARSSHYEEIDKLALTYPEGENLNPHPKTPALSKSMTGNGPSPASKSKHTAGKKRKQPSDVGTASEQNTWNQELSDTVANAMMEMVASVKSEAVVKSQLDGRFTITKCIKALDEIEGVEDGIYYAALDLFENPSFRETFLSIQTNNVRLSWLRGKCQNLLSTM